MAGYFTQDGSLFRDHVPYVQYRVESLRFEPENEVDKNRFMNVERRRHHRISVKFLVEYRGQNVWQSVQTYNISQGGMFIATDKVEAPGTRIEILFEVGKEDNLRRIHADAVVVWNRKETYVNGEGKRFPAGMGIEFKKIFPSDGEKFLKEVIEKWEKKDG